MTTNNSQNDYSPSKVDKCTTLLNALKLNAEGLLNFIKQADDYKICLIKQLELEDGDESYRSIALQPDDYTPIPCDFEALKQPLAFKAPLNHANNSLPRYFGYINLPAELESEAVVLWNHYRYLQNEFKQESKALAESSTIPTISRTATLRKAGIFEKGENYELTQRNLELITEKGIQEIQARWIINHYSQPSKRTAKEMLDYIETSKEQDDGITRTPDFIELVNGVNKAIKNHGYDITFVKRFYVPPYISTRYKDSEGNWSKNFYTSFPITFIGLKPETRIKVDLQRLDAYVENGSIRAIMPKARKSTAAKATPVANHWYYLVN